MSGNPLNLLFGAAGLLLKPFGGGKAKPQAAPPVARPQAVTRSTAVIEAISNRRGSRANQRTGPGGAEATGGKKTELGA